MSATQVPVVSSVVAPEALAALLTATHPLKPPVRCRLASRGMNDTYRVETGAGACFLRLSPAGWRTAAQIEAEAALLEDLHAAGVPVARCVRRRDGAALTPVLAPEGERWAVLFAPAEGEDLREIDAGHARAYGRWAAAFHAAADAGPAYDRFPLDEHHLVDEPLAAIRAALPDGGDDLTYLETVAARVRPRIAALPRSGPGFGLCHGDLHPGNARFSAGDLPTVFDFDCGGQGWRAYDLAVFLWNAAGEGRSTEWKAERWAAFLAGYRELRPFSAEQEATVPLFLVARQLWLMGLDAAGRTEWPPQWITPGWLRQGADAVRAWVAEDPILAG